MRKGNDPFFDLTNYPHSGLWNEVMDQWDHIQTFADLKEFHDRLTVIVAGCEVDEAQRALREVREAIDHSAQLTIGDLLVRKEEHEVAAKSDHKPRVVSWLTVRDPGQCDWRDCDSPWINCYTGIPGDPDPRSRVHWFCELHGCRVERGGKDGILWEDVDGRIYSEPYAQQA